MAGLLIRSNVDLKALQSSKGLGFQRFEFEPLFKNDQRASNLGAATTYRWYLAQTPASLAGANPWDIAHQALGSGQGLALGPEVVFVEPDLEQQYLAQSPAAEQFAARGKTGVADPQDPGLPQGPGFAWFLLDEYSQLRRARDFANGSAVTIGHLDTGYDPAHETKPTGLMPDYGWDFVENRRDTADPKTGGTLKNPGHGTGTLSILAGSHADELPDTLGGAPKARVVPVRVANSVLLFRTSAFAKALDYILAPRNDKGDTLPPVDVVTLSMGGVASQAWAEAVNRAYEAGVCIVAAAGNNFSGGIVHFPTRFIVYPARFRRVIAACGIMANQSAYDGLPFGTMQGNFGPSSKMDSAVSAYTPNMPWAEIGYPSIIDMDGQGTSAATPQVAAAAALWIQKHASELNGYSARWQRVEAVRNALFNSAQMLAAGREKLGKGALRAAAALQLPAPAEAALQFTPPDSAILSLFRVLTGIGIAAEESGRERMFSLEAAQLLHRWPKEFAARVEDLIPDPDLPFEQIPSKQAAQLLEMLSVHPDASQPLRKRCEEAAARMGASSRSVPTPKGGGARVLAKAGSQAAAAPALAKAAPVPELPKPPQPLEYPEPTYKCLRGYAVDPSLQTQLATEPISTVIFKVPWESVDPGPVGEYLEVIDYDPASKCFYDPIDLEDRYLLAQDGLPPSQGVPQFHQQMVYAVASTTIQHFERALGRPAQWRPGPSPDPRQPKDDSYYVRRLRIYPHALREANAYYSPQKIALLFGYYPASADDPASHIPGGVVFTCLSHDIVAHETSHALLDGMHRSYTEPTNPDVQAGHEAFADIVAMFQHFTYPDLVRHQIANARGEIRQHENLLAQLAGEFGRSTGMRGALRDAIGSYDPATKQWTPHTPDPTEYENTTEPHARGAILVAAVFDAFLSIYERRTQDLLRIATNGTGVLPTGALHPDLVGRLSEEVSKAASHTLGMCIRALDYCPPTDLTFGEFLRALITADRDLVADDDLHYRVAFIEAFRHRGIYPRDLRTLSEESLTWRGPEQDARPVSGALMSLLQRLRPYADRYTYTTTREQVFYLERDMRRDLHGWLKSHFETNPNGPEDAAYLGLSVAAGQPASFEVRSARFSNRVGPDGQLLMQCIIELLQTRKVDPGDGTQIAFQGGSTVIADLRTLTIRYCVRKDIESQTRLGRQLAFQGENGSHSLRETYFGFDNEEPFAFMHRG